jgi:nucleoside-diphosphate-sugar epimerase
MSLHLIPGGSGFVGSHTAEYLLDRGESVRILDIVPPDVPGTDIEDRVEYVSGDVTRMDDVSAAMADVDYVHHNVALVPLTKAGDRFWDVNVGGTRNVLQAALDKGVDGVTHISSSSVYDIQHNSMPVTEETPTGPIGAYGKSKLAADRVALQYAKRGLPVNIVRPRTVVDERRAGIYALLFEWVENDQRVFMLGDGTNKFQLVSGRDLADASYLAATSDISGEVFNIGNLEYNTLGEDLRHLIEYAGSDSSLTFVPATPASAGLQFLDKLRLSPLAPYHYRTVFLDYYFDVSKAMNVLGWEPTDGNYDMFERAYNWHGEHELAEADSSGSIHRSAPKKKIFALAELLP